MKKILLVDDDLDLLFVMEKMLLSNGYYATATDDGNKVLDLMKLSMPDLIILDINLGERDGREICESIKADPAFRHIPIILYSAEQGVEKEIEDCEAAAFIKKPFTKHLLLEKLRQVIAA